MTATEFGAWAVGYYGPWPKGMQADIRDYLLEKSPEYLAMLKAVCLETIPSRLGQVNGYPPDVAVLESIAGETGQRIEADNRHKRELAYDAKMLPAPDYDNVSTEGMVKLDWSMIFAQRLNARAG